MSVFAPKKLCTYEAPMSISDSKAVVSGSWYLVENTSNAMDANLLLQFRLHKWKQQVGSRITEACLDWVMKNENGQLRHYAIVKFHGQHFASFQNPAFLDHITQVLKEQNSMIIGIKNSIDHTLKT